MEMIKSIYKLFSFVALTIISFSAYAQEPTEHVTGLSATVNSDQSITLNWTAAGGANLPSNYLVIAARTTGGTQKTVADGTAIANDTDFSAANFDGALNITFGTNTATFTTLVAGTSYDFKVYSYKTGGTPNPDFKTDGTIPAITASTFVTVPGTQASGLQITAKTETTVDLLWTSGSGAKTLIVARASASANTAPSNGTTYTADPSFGTGTEIGTANYVVFSDVSTTTTTTVTNLTAGVEYVFTAYTFDGATVTSNYKTTTAPTATGYTLATKPTTQITNLGVSGTTSSSISLSWDDDGDGANTIVVARAINAVNTPPVSGASYVENNLFTSADEIGSSGNFVVHTDIKTANSVTITGLTTGTTYHFAVYTFNGTVGTGAENYLTTTVSTTSGAPPAATTSTLVVGATNNATVSSLKTAAGNNVKVFDFLIDDKTGDDAVGMDISALTIKAGANNDITNWDEVIAGVILSDGTNNYTPNGGNLVITNNSIQISGIPTGAPASNVGSIAADGSKTLELRIWLKTNLSGTQNYNNTIDGQDFVFSIDANTDITVSGSQFTATQTAITNDNKNVVTVVATKINVATQPSSNGVIGVSLSQMPVFEARDVNGNLDLGFSETVTVATTAPNNIAFNRNGDPTAFSAGKITYVDAYFNATGTSTMKLTTSSITGGNSTATNSITIKLNALFTQNNTTVAVSPLSGGTEVALISARIKLSTPGSGTIQSITINTDITSLDKFTGFKLYRSTDNTFSAGDKLIVADTARFTDRIEFTNLSYPSHPEYYSISDADEWYFVVATVKSSVSGATPAITFTWNPGLTIISNSATINSSFQSEAYTFADTSAPDIETYTPSHNALAVPLNANIVLKFTETIQKDASNGSFISIKRKSNNSVFESFEVKPSAKVTIGGNSNKFLTINPTNDFESGTIYYITMDDGAIRDLQDNDFAGIDNSTTFYEFKTYAPPTITSVSAESCVGNVMTITGTNLASYPGTGTGVTSVEFCDINGLNCVIQDNGSKIVFVNDNEITVTVPATSVTGKVKINMSSDNTGIGTNPSGTDTSTDNVTLGIELIKLPPNNSNEKVVCAEETNLVYEIDSDFNGLTYNWSFDAAYFDSRIPSPTSPGKIDDAGKAILMRVLSLSPSDSVFLSVVGIRNANGGPDLKCESEPVMFGISIKPTPNIHFDINPNQANTNDSVELILIKNLGNPGEAIVINSPTEPVNFTANKGVYFGNDNTFYFDATQFNIDDQEEIIYTYSDKFQCKTDGSELITIYDGTSQIPQLKSDFCEDDLITDLFEWDSDPVNGPVVTVDNATISVHLGKSQNDLDITSTMSDYGFLYGGGIINPIFRFNPGIAKNKIVDNDAIILTLHYLYKEDGGPDKDGNVTIQVHKNPQIPGFEFPVPELEAEAYRVNNGIYEICSTVPSGNFINDGIPINLIRNEINTKFKSKYTAIFNDQAYNASVIDLTGNTFDPSDFVPNPNNTIGEIINVTHELSIVYGPSTCKSYETKQITVFPEPAAPSIEFEKLNSDIVNEPLLDETTFACAFDDKINEVTVNNLFWEAVGKTVVNWSDQNDGSDPISANQISFKPEYNKLDPGNNNRFYAIQIYDDLCKSEVTPIKYEYFPDLTNTLSRSILNEDPTFEIDIENNDYSNGTILIDIDEYLLNLKSLSNPNTDDSYTNASSGVFVQNGFSSTPTETAKFNLDRATLEAGLFEITLNAVTSNECINELITHVLFIKDLPVPDSYFSSFGNPDYDPKPQKSTFVDNQNWFSFDFNKNNAVGQKFISTTGWGHTVENINDIGMDKFYLESESGWATRAIKILDESTPDVSDYLPGYYLGDGKQSYLISPAFRISHFDRPMVKLLADYHLKNDGDGIVLQYTTDEIITEQTEWKTVGALNSGVKWYNGSNINSNPGLQANDKYGWSESFTQSFEELKNQMGQKSADFAIFRLALGTDMDNKGNTDETDIEGFNFKEFELGNRTRTVLVESFTNQGGPPTIVANQNSDINTFISAKEASGETKVVLINYRTSFPDVDDALLKEGNNGHHGARVNYYNISNVPSVRIDGLTSRGNENANWDDWSESYYGQRSLKISDFRIKNISNDIIVEYLDKTSDGNQQSIDSVYVQIAYVLNSGDYNNLLYSFEPDASGHFYETYAPGQIETIPMTPPSGADKIIVFIQKVTQSNSGGSIYLNGEVMQAEEFDIPSPLPSEETITSTEDLENSEIILYPNPAKNLVNIDFNSSSSALPHQIHLIDIRGNIVWKGDFAPDTKHIEIDTHNFASGVYVVQIMNDAKMVIKRVVIN